MVNGTLPLKLFLPRDRSPKLVRMLKEDGRVPVRRLFSRDRACNWRRLPILSGMFPSIRLRERDRYTSDVDRLEIDEGSIPPNSFEAKSRYCNWEQLDKVDMKFQSPGVVACSRLFERASDSRFCKPPTSGGTVPLKKLYPSSILCSSEEFANMVGTWPGNWL